MSSISWVVQGLLRRILNHEHAAVVGLIEFFRRKGICVAVLGIEALGVGALAVPDLLEVEGREGVLHQRGISS